MIVGMDGGRICHRTGLGFWFALSIDATGRMRNLPAANPNKAFC
ncbi:hypothetical protein TERTU_0488 [Teredinibacter turnerae T7901]|uniref:Uncharacterized protein n=1 Tax=Teredinibacter turnerae (strain ATCC 39867 / T7901) TaxID=377629 RepID=C5BMZ4_TERTT|nr:hypothetical protein TERTU_0488 [Teredinibacter turnerae T7901]